MRDGILIGLMCAWMATGYLAIRARTPMVSIIGRWVRWFLLAFLIAYLIESFQENPHPLWVLCVVGFLLWFLIESTYTWILIHILNRSSVALFPRFTRANEPNIPIDPPFLHNQRTLALAGFSLTESLHATFDSVNRIQAYVYENKARTKRIQALLIPRSMSGSFIFYSVYAQGKDGKRYGVDNLFLPFGIAYPESGHFSRKPWVNDPKILIQHHNKMTESVELAPFDQDPCSDLNAFQSVLEGTNIERGLLFPKPLQAQYGKLTQEGRYQLWKSLLILHYLGIA